MDFPPLYKEKRIWKISVNKHVMTRSYGMEGGKLQLKESKGNEAIARKLWGAQQNKGYVEREQVHFSPMLPHPYTMFKRHVPDYIYLQPKLNGLRLLIERNNRRQIIFTTRSGRELKGISHMRERFNEILTTPDVIIDCELYDPNLPFDDFFANIENGDDSTMELHVYDCYLREHPKCHYRERHVLLKVLLSGTYMETDRIDLVETKYKHKNKIQKHFDFCALKKWEGVTIRDPKGIYAPGKRTKVFLELIHPQKREYQICGHTKDMGGYVTWVCCTTTGKTFEIDPIEPTKTFNDKDKWVGIKFKEYMDDGFPRAPVALSLRT